MEPYADSPPGQSQNDLPTRPPDTSKPKLLDQVRAVLRLHHYSIHTERSYLDWIRRYVRFHAMKSRQDLSDGERKIETFLSNLAIEGKVSASTQNQAMNALVFMYRKVLELPLNDRIDAVRAERRVVVPVVMNREETARVISLMQGTPQLIVKMLYGSGLRIMEAVRLRVKDLDCQMKQVTVRSGKGDKDRFTTMSGSLIPLLQNHLARVKSIHEQDLHAGHGQVYLPNALDREKSFLLRQPKITRNSSEPSIHQPLTPSEFRDPTSPIYERPNFFGFPSTAQSIGLSSTILS